jgi:hypothetical protein
LPQKIKLWLSHQGKAGAVKGNPWGDWLTRFRTPTTAPPRRLADYQYYMQHADYKAKVAEAFNAQKMGAPLSETLNLRAQVARNLFAAELQEVRTRIKEENEVEHADLAAKHEDALEGLPSLDEESLEE